MNLHSFFAFWGRADISRYQLFTETVIKIKYLMSLIYIPRRILQSQANFCRVIQKILTKLFFAELSA